MLTLRQKLVNIIANIKKHNGKSLLTSPQKCEHHGKSLKPIAEA